jgi:plastocyanin
MFVRSIRSTSVIIAASLIVGAALVSTAGAEVQARHTPTRAVKTVKGISTHWSPTTVRISAGDRIKWRAISNTHTVTSYRANWHFNQALAQGATVSHRFSHAGTFRFRCMIHSTLSNGVCSGMCGKVVVSG